MNYNDLIINEESPDSAAELTSEALLKAIEYFKKASEERPQPRQEIVTVTPAIYKYMEKHGYIKDGELTKKYYDNLGDSITTIIKNNLY